MNKMDSSSSNIASNSFDNPRPYDILCGRNRNSFNNIGNRRFRITISMNVEKYNSMRSRHQRSKFIASLAQTMRYEVGFRFLKRKGGKNAQTVELSDDEIRAKIGHALRDLSSTMQQDSNGRNANANPESKVPRPGPYIKQDKKALRMVSSASSLETMSSAQSTLDGTTKLAASMPTPCPTPVTVSSSSSAQVKSSLTPSSVATIQEHHWNAEKAAAAAAAAAVPDQVRSCSPPLHLMLSKFPLAEENTTPLHSNLLVNKNAMVTPDEQDYNWKLPLYPLEIGEACQTLLNPPPTYLIPSLDDEDEMDDFWRTSELVQNEDSPLAPRSRTANMSIGSNCDNMSLPSSCCLSDAMETLSLVSNN
jgi:hypothetical protein